MSNNDNKKLKNNDEINKTPESITKNLFKKAFEEDTKTDNTENTYDEDFSSESYKNIIKKYTEDLFYEDDEDEDNEFNQDDIYFEDEYFENEEEDNTFNNNDDDENYFDTKKATIDENKYRKKIDKYGDEFFNEDENEEDEKPVSPFKILSISAIVILIISTTILAVSLQLTKSKVDALKEENQQLVYKNQDAENKLLQDTLKNKITELEEKNSELQSIVNGDAPANDKNTEKTSNNQSKPQNNSNNSSITEYTVKEKDSFWKISEAVYGDGSHYKKIIEANNLTENSKLTPGQKLKIPKIN